MTYVAEDFTPEESDILRRYFTNLDRPVFALVNLPEVVKGALFARYSRSPKSLRRLFLDEFVGDLDIGGDETVDATMGLSRAEELALPPPHWLPPTPSAMTPASTHNATALNIESDWAHGSVESNRSHDP